MKVAEKIKSKRVELNLTQEEFAAKLGVSQQLIGYYERGRNLPKPEFHKKWSEVFGEELLIDFKDIPEVVLSNLRESPLGKQIQKQGYTIESAAEKAGISYRMLYIYIDKFDRGELDKRIFDFLALNLNFQEAFVKAYHKKLDDDGLVVTSLNQLFADFNEGGYAGEGVFFNGRHLNTETEIIESLTATLPNNKYITLEVESKFMHPAISIGDKIICEEVNYKFYNRPSNFFIYFIRSSDNVYLTRVYKQNEDEWILKMDNHPDIIHFDPVKIISLHLIRSVIHIEDAAPKMFEVPKEAGA